MKSLLNLSDLPVGAPLRADDVVEFHAARLLLLLRVCGVKGRIDGLTKLAKLDFFVRYPDFFARVSNRLPGGLAGEQPRRLPESLMVRHHYGPWDKRYYHVLAYLEARGLVQIDQGPHRSYGFSLTTLGASRAARLQQDASFHLLVDQMRLVKRAFGAWKGSRLKALIYDLFDEDVAARPLGQVIAP